MAVIVTALPLGYEETMDENIEMFYSPRRRLNGGNC